MEIEELIHEIGLEKALKSIFSNLAGINLSEVRYDKGPE